MLGIFSTTEPFINFSKFLFHFSLEPYLCHACSLPQLHLNHVCGLHSVSGGRYRQRYMLFKQKRSLLSPIHIHWSQWCQSARVHSSDRKPGLAFPQHFTPGIQVLTHMSDRWQRSCVRWIFYTNMPAEQWHFKRLKWSNSSKCHIKNYIKHKNCTHITYTHWGGRPLG